MSGILRENALSAITLTLASACAGGLIFALLRLPAPWLSGSLIGVVVLLALGFRPRLPDPLRDLGMVFAGAVTGSAITPEMIRAVGRYPASLVMLALTSVAVVIAGRLVLERGFGWDRRTALFATLPGALSAVIAAVSAIGGDMTRVVAVQAFRMFVLVALLPGVVFMALGASEVAGAGMIDAASFALMMTLALIVSLAFARLGIMAPFLLGGMAAAGILHVTGAIHGAPPMIVTDIAMLLVGAFAGSRFVLVEASVIRSLIVPGLAIFFVTTAIAAIGAVLTAWFFGLNLAETLVAFAPGGLEAMVMLGLALGLDPLYVSSHHVARFVAIAALVPVLARWITDRH